MAILIKANTSILVSNFSLGLVLPLNSFENVLMFLFNLLLATTIVFLNTSVFMSILLNSSLRHENRFMYMLSTCLSDACTGVLYYYCGLLDVQDNLYSPTRTYYVAPGFLGLSLIVVQVAQADRYHAISAPFKYSQRMTQRRTLILILVIWVYVFILGAINDLVPVEIGKLITGNGPIVTNVFIFIIMVGLNVRLFMIARFQLDREPQSKEREAKRASIYLIVAVSVCFIITWLPLLMYVFMCNVTKIKCYIFKNEGLDPMRILPRVNAAITPALYICGCASLRTTLLSKVWRTCYRPKSVKPKPVERPGAPSVHAVSMLHKI